MLYIVLIASCLLQTVTSLVHYSKLLCTQIAVYKKNIQLPLLSWPNWGMEDMRQPSSFNPIL